MSESAIDNWKGRRNNMLCGTCIWFVAKQVRAPGDDGRNPPVGRCRRRAPTMNGYPVVFDLDWCGDHKLDENAR